MTHVTARWVIENVGGSENLGYTFFGTRDVSRLDLGPEGGGISPQKFESPLKLLAKVTFLLFTIYYL